MGEHAEWTFTKGRGIEGSKMDMGGQNYPKPKIVHVFYGLARI